MSRPIHYTPSTDPWAAMVARGLTTHGMASKYRNGHAVPSAARVEELRALGYEVEVTDFAGVRVATCDRWPEGEVTP